MDISPLKTIHRLFNIFFNIFENLIDLAILIEHFRQNNINYFILSLFFFYLPNIIIILCSTFHFLFSRNSIKQSFLSILLISSNLDVILPNVVLIGHESSPKTNEKNKILELLDIKFILLISNCFHILFNNYPFGLVQFNYLITYYNIPREFVFLLVTKILISILKINTYSVKLVYHFFKNEFSINVPKIFPTIRFMTNFLFLTSKAFVYSIAYLFAPNIVISLLIIKYISIFILNCKFIGFANSLEAFWSFFWTVCEQICFIQDLSFRTKLNKFKLLINFSEFLFLSILNLTFEFKNLELTSPKLFLVLIIISFFMSYCLELFYWCLNPIWTGNRCEDSIFIEKLKLWLRNQSEGSSFERLIDLEDNQQTYLIGESSSLSGLDLDFQSKH